MGEGHEDEPVHEVDAGPEGSLRGTLVTVLLMAAFFAAAWLGMYSLLLARR